MKYMVFGSPQGTLTPPVLVWNLHISTLRDCRGRWLNFTRGPKRVEVFVMKKGYFSRILSSLLGEELAVGDGTRGNAESCCSQGATFAMREPGSLSWTAADEQECGDWLQAGDFQFYGQPGHEPFLGYRPRIEREEGLGHIEEYSDESLYGYKVDRQHKDRLRGGTGNQRAGYIP